MQMRLCHVSHEGQPGGHRPHPSMQPGNVHLLRVASHHGQVLSVRPGSTTFVRRKPRECHWSFSNSHFKHLLKVDPLQVLGRAPSPEMLHEDIGHSTLCLPSVLLGFFLLLLLLFRAGLIQALSAFPLLLRNFFLVLDSELWRTKGQVRQRQSRGRS